MKVLFYIFVLFLLLIVIFYPFIGYNYSNNVNVNFNVNANARSKEKFLTPNIDPEQDGNMKFTYLTNQNYANSILSRYYVNNDTKLFGTRMVQHPLQFARSPNGRDRYYGTLFNNKTKSDNIYKNTGLRL